MRATPSVIALALALFAPAHVLSAPQNRWINSMQERSTIAVLPRGWELHPEHPNPQPDHVIELKIGLTQNKIDELIGHLMEVSDPAHTRYGKHLSKESAFFFRTRSCMC